MLFNSLHFLIFFPVVVTTFFLVAHTYRWLLLLLASYYFYMAWEPAYGLLLLLSTTIDYTAGRLMGSTPDPRVRRLILTASIASNLGILFFFKYFNFFFDTLNSTLEFLRVDFESPVLHILLPVGISFFTFQSLSYTIDVYRGVRAPEKHFGIFALYLSFFPQLVAGPIERSTRLLPQLYKKMTPHPTQIASGLRLMLWGFFKKVVIADNAAHIVEAVYRDPHAANGIALTVGTIFFAIQLYADFSGYTDIARGSARVMGYDLMLNFRRPYAARSISDFWNRWHISLTSWFQDHIFKPLYFKFSHAQRLATFTPPARHTISFAASTFIGLFLLGLWHGAGFNFILFGLSQAIFIVSYQLIRRFWDRLPFFIAYSGTAIQVLIGFIFFRASTVSDALEVYKGIATDLSTYVLNPSVFIPAIIAAKWTLNVALSALIFLALASIFMFVVEGLYAASWFSRKWHALPYPLRWLAYYVILALIIFGGDYGESAFIYFQF